MTTNVAFFDADENEISSTTFQGELSAVDLNTAVPFVARIQITNNDGKTVNITRTNHSNPPVLDGVTAVNWKEGVTQHFLYKPQNDTFLAIMGPFGTAQVLSKGVELASGDIGGMMSRLSVVARKNEVYDVNITPQSSGLLEAVALQETRIYSGLTSAQLSDEGILLEITEVSRIDLPDGLRDEILLNCNIMGGESFREVTAPLDLTPGIWFITPQRRDGALTGCVQLGISKPPPIAEIAIQSGEMLDVDLTGKGVTRYTVENTSRLPYLAYATGSGGTLLDPSGSVITTQNGVVSNPAQGKWAMEFPAGITGAVAAIIFAPWLTTESPVTSFEVNQHKQQMFSVYHDGVTRMEITAHVDSDAPGLMMCAIEIAAFQPLVGGIVNSMVLDNTLPEGDYLVQMLGTSEGTLTGTIQVAYIA